MRRGFGLVYAIIVLVLIATLGIYTLELSSRSVKSVSDEHIKIQLKLYMNSAVEYALLWLSESKARSQAVADLNVSFEDGSYRVQIQARPTTLPVPESNGTMVMDLLGRFDATGAEPLVIGRRLLVKP